MIKSKPIKTIKIHPLCEAFPLMNQAELNELAHDIKANGQREPILLLDGKILDGRNRFEACKLVEIAPRFEKVKTKDPRALVASMNLFRRHLSESQRAMLVIELVESRRGRPGKNTARAVINQIEAAELAHVSEDTIQRAEIVKRSGAKAIKSEVRKGTISVNAAAKLAKLDKRKQARLAKQGPAAMEKAARGGLAADAMKLKAGDSPKAKMLAALINFQDKRLPELVSYGEVKPVEMIEEFRKLIEETL